MWKEQVKWVLLWFTLSLLTCMHSAALILALQYNLIAVVSLTPPCILPSLPPLPCLTLPGSSPRCSLTPASPCPLFHSTLTLSYSCRSGLTFSVAVCTVCVLWSPCNPYYLFVAFPCHSSLCSDASKLAQQVINGCSLFCFGPVGFVQQTVTPPRQYARTFYNYIHHKGAYRLSDTANS